ncbi:hypothetical protein PInf_011701 [Phytophthora infestans]|nr:hypothetical protein PInf_011701 [Phytophthora infestans]
MKKSEDQPRFDDLSPRVDASGSEAEEESTRKGKMQERELGSDAPDWKEKSSDARNKHGDSTGSRAKTIEEAQQPRATVDPRTESQFHTLSTDETDEDESNYQIVKKSIYKPQRKGFLSRLAGSPMASPKQKYALSDITGIITGEEAETVEFPSKSNEEEEVGDVDLTAEDEEGIEVAIDRSGKALHGARGGREHRLLSAEDAAMGGPSEVVIHSGEISNENCQIKVLS